LKYSGSHISAIARKFSGMTLFDYRMTFCMEEAATLLTQTSKSIAEIAGDLNFSNRTHFYRQFKKRFQVTPHEYRRIRQAF
ncbi:MAG TPA: AraC family transcriptional regulator, partial [Clostridiales bacterium]|nr:AraC family transcriptional regulator [Clostridiales bacterium]